MINANIYGIKISTDKSKVMINFNKSINKSIDIHLFDCKLEEVDKLKY